MSMSAIQGIFDMVKRAPDDVALCDQSGQLTWAEASRRINETAEGLLDVGFRNGRLAVLGSNSSTTVIVYAAALLAGVGVILLNYHSPADEFELPPRRWRGDRSLGVLGSPPGRE